MLSSPNPPVKALVPTDNRPTPPAVHAKPNSLADCRESRLHGSGRSLVLFIRASNWLSASWLKELAAAEQRNVPTNKEERGKRKELMAKAEERGSRAAEEEEEEREWGNRWHGAGNVLHATHKLNFDLDSCKALLIL
eukprot:GHVS01078271.1.p2 GENE.GHVS01078271.1~~GHVS01078271.1.p2  ORF type:complete len:137 (+),score=37.46 GHVS01078271.1:967-1377(+)